MRLLVVGGGGREHAIIWKLGQSALKHEIFCAPGNGGISEIAECVNIAADDISGLLKFAMDKNIDFTIVGPEVPLALGIVDEFKKEGLSIFGPDKNGARLEGSKAYAKQLMEEYGIPTARCAVFHRYEEALEYVRAGSFPVVIKADELAQGKGVTICGSFEEADGVLKELMINKIFGEGETVVIEEFLTGPEVSVLAFCDGNALVPMVSAQDHKRAFDGDAGPNTGGMGTFSPSRYYTKEAEEACRKTIFEPTLKALKDRGGYQGVIFFGLMLTKDGPKVIEYNCRFGDPETQVVLPRLKGDLLEIFIACSEGRLNELDIRWEDNAAACVIMASGGYPGKYEKGIPIAGLAEAANEKDVMVFHAGTKNINGEILTDGGRVLGVAGWGKSLDSAIEKAYEAVDLIKFKDVHYRRDIGRR